MTFPLCGGQGGVSNCMIFLGLEWSMGRDEELADLGGGISSKDVGVKQPEGRSPSNICIKSN